MGDGGWRRIDAPAEWHVLTLLRSRGLLGPDERAALHRRRPPLPLSPLVYGGGVSAARSRAAR